MKDEKHLILAIHVTNRTQHASDLQAVLSDFGCYIKTRLGLHDAEENFCSGNGIIILELLDNLDKMLELKGKVNSIAGVSAKEIVFEH